MWGGDRSPDSPLPFGIDSSTTHNTLIQSFLLLLSDMTVVPRALDVSFERSDGFQGPIVVYDPTNDDEMQLQKRYDAEEILFLQDWYHQDGNVRRTGESRQTTASSQQTSPLFCGV